MTDQEPIEIAVEQESPVEDSGQEPAELTLEACPEATEPEQEPSELECLRAELEQAQAKANEYLDGWQRARAEFANYRRREEQGRQQLGDAIKGQVLSDLLPVVDDLDRAFQAVPAGVRDTAWVKGLLMVGDKFQTFLRKAGVTAMDLRPGAAFDPNLHQAVFHGPSVEYGEGQIVEVFQRGYKLGDAVLRPAMVYVSSGAPDAPCATGDPVNESDAASD